MLGFIEEFGLQLLLLLVAGIIWVIGRVAERAAELRRKTREKMEEADARGGIAWPGPAEPPAPEPAPKPVPTPVRPPRRPPRRIQVKQATKPAPRAPREPAPRQTPATQTLLARLRGDPRRLREAVVLREVLGPPRALQRLGPPGRRW